MGLKELLIKMKKWQDELDALDVNDIQRNCKPSKKCDDQCNVKLPCFTLPTLVECDEECEINSCERYCGTYCDTKKEEKEEKSDCNTCLKLVECDEECEINSCERSCEKKSCNTESNDCKTIGIKIPCLDIP